MAAAAAISLSFHFRFRPPFPSPRTPTRHAPFSLFSPSLLAPCRLRVAPGRPSPSPWRPDVRARAGSTIGAPPALVRPGGAVETDRLPSDVRDRAMEAVDHFGGRVTIGDVASRAGLQLAQAERALQALAADTEGFLEVRRCLLVTPSFPPPLVTFRPSLIIVADCVGIGGRGGAIRLPKGLQGKAGWQIV